MGSSSGLMVFYGDLMGTYSRIYGDCYCSVVGLCGVFAFVSSFMNAEWKEMGLDGDYYWIMVLQDAHWDVPIGYLTAMGCNADS